MRFQVEAVAHELHNPGWFRGWLARQGAPSSQAASGSRVKPPMTPWMAFVHVRPCACTSLHLPLTTAMPWTAFGQQGPHTCPETIL